MGDRPPRTKTLVELTVLTVGSLPALRTDALVQVDFVDTCSPILTWPALTVIYIWDKDRKTKRERWGGRGRTRNRDREENKVTGRVRGREKESMQ